MHITMVKKRLADGSECRKCVDATDHLRSRGLWEAIDEVVWAREDDPASAGLRLAADLDVDRAPFFIVDDEHGRAVYLSVLQLVRDKLNQPVSVQEEVSAIDADDIGGI